MKQTKLLFLSLMPIFFTFPNVFSQPNEIIKLIGKDLSYDIIYQQLEKPKNYLSKEYFLNKFHKCNSKINILGITEVVDSVIVTRLDGSITKNKCTYDSNGNMTSSLYEEWDGINWVNYWRYTYTYDSNSNMTSSLYEDWDGINWVNSRKWTYTYDSNGNRTLSLLQGWDGTNWVNGWQFTETYDSNGNRTSSLSEEWDGTNWVNYWREIYTYDSNSNMTSSLYEDWDGINWVNSRRATKTYDSNGNRTSSLSEEWDGTNWVNYWRTIYTYDSIGNMTSLLFEFLDGTNWVNDWRYTITYDTNSNMTSYSSEGWGGTNWVNYWREIYTYDSNGNMTSGLYESWNGTNWVLSNGYLRFSDSFGKYFSFSGAKIEVFYKTITNISKNEIAILNYSLSQNYPNPFNPTTIISYSTPKPSAISLKVFDVLGNEVKTLVNEHKPSGNYAVLFDASELPSGIYFYMLQSGGFSETKKLILIK